MICHNIICSKSWLELLFLVVIICLAALFSITSGATIIVIQKDWVVVLFGQDKDRLAVVNFWIRAIELGSFVDL